MLNVVIPVHASKNETAKKLADRIIQLGKISQHRLYLLGQNLPNDVLELFQSAFDDVRYINYDGSIYRETYVNWLNAAFVYTVRQALKDETFFWLEPNSLPLHVNWLNVIEKDYILSGKPQYGALTDHYVKEVYYENDERKEQVIHKGLRLHRTAIYNAVTFQRVDVMAVLDTLPDSEELFDVKFKDAFFATAHHSAYIQCNNGSCKYCITEAGDNMASEKLNEYASNKELTPDKVLLTGFVDDTPFDEIVKCNLTITVKDPFDNGKVYADRLGDSATPEKLLEIETRLAELENKVNAWIKSSSITPLSENVNEIDEQGNVIVRRGRRKVTQNV